MESEARKIYKEYLKIKESNLQIHCITNNVTINDCANILHAIGASPIMAKNISEVEEVVSNSSAFVCNFGAIDDFEAIKEGCIEAEKKGIPIVIDPVGVGGISYRREMFFELMKSITPTCIRGNASEITALVEKQNTVKGVNSNKKETRLIIEKNVVRLSKKLGCIVVASGETDIISDGMETYKVGFGDILMTRISGTGCMLSSIVGAFLSSENSVKSVKKACIIFAICGEIAAKKTRREKMGIMTFKTNFIDCVSNLEYRKIKKIYNKHS